MRGPLPPPKGPGQPKPSPKPPGEPIRQNINDASCGKPPIANPVRSELCCVGRGFTHRQLSTWRRQHERGALKALSQSRGRRPSRRIANQELSRLEKENARLKEELRKAQVIIEVQKKVSTLLSQSEAPIQELPNR